MIKSLLAEIRWGKLSPEQEKELNTLYLIEVFRRPYLTPKLHKHY